MISMKKKDDTPPKFNIAFAKWWLEAPTFLLGFGNFSGASVKLPEGISVLCLPKETVHLLQELPCSAHEMTKHRSQAMFFFWGGVVMMVMFSYPVNIQRFHMFFFWVHSGNLT